MDNEKSFVQREQRFEVGDLSGFDAIVCRAGADESLYYAELVDFSRSGVKFSLPFFAKFDEILNVKFEFKNMELRYSGFGRVRHIRNIEQNRWHVGCSIEPPLPEDVICHLASRSNQERRRFPRIDVVGYGSVSRQGSIKACSAKVVNISEGGFCLFVDEAHVVGQRIDFLIENADGVEEKIAARVRWQFEIDGGYRVGCCFAHSESYPKLVDCLTLQDDSARNDSISWYVAAAAILAMFLPPFAYFLMGSSEDEARATTVAKAQVEELDAEQFDSQQSVDTESTPAADLDPFGFTNNDDNQVVIVSSDFWPNNDAEGSAGSLTTTNSGSNVVDSHAGKVDPEPAESDPVAIGQDTVVASLPNANSGNGVRTPSKVPLQLQRAPRLVKIPAPGIGPSSRRDGSSTTDSNNAATAQQQDHSEIQPPEELLTSSKIKPRKSRNASSRRGDSNRPLYVPSEVIRKRLLSDNGRG